MKYLRRRLIFTLCLCLMLSLIGCGKTDEEGTVTQTTASVQGSDNVQGTAALNSSPENPAKEAYLYVPSFETVEGILDLGPEASLCGNTLYTEQRTYGEAKEDLRYEIWSLELTTMEAKQLSRNLGENEYAMSFTKLADQTLVILTMISGGERSQESSRFFLVFCDENGQEVRRSEITEAVNGDGKWEADELYPEDLEADREGNIYVMLGGMDTVLLGFDPQGKLLFTVEESGPGDGLYRSESGDVFCIGDKRGAGESSCVLRRLDAASGGFAETWEGLPGLVDQACFAGEDTLLISSGNTLYRYDMASKSREEVLNWINMDILANDILMLTMLPDGRILVLTRQYNGNETQLEAAYLTRMPVSEVTQKALVTIGGLSINYFICEQVIAFNKRSDSCRILVKEYGEDEAGRMRLQSDLLAGNGPDILDLAAVNADALIARGFLADLYPLMNECPDTAKEDFLPNVLSIYEQDGGLYGIVPGFHIESLMGKVSVIGDGSGWSIEEVQALLEEKPGTQLIYGAWSSREMALPKLLMLNMDHFVDWSSGSCSFDGEEFQNVLEFASMLPTQAEARRDDDFMDKIARDELLLVEFNIIRVVDYQLQHAFFANEPVNCIGYPSSNGRGTLLEPWLSLGILESCPHKEAAWEFISWLLADEFQMLAPGFLPIRESTLEKHFKEAMESEGTKYGYNGMGFDLSPATEADAQAIRGMIDAGQGASMADTMILQIIDEEAAAYFTGQKTVEEVAKIIQSRVQLYVDENR